MIPFIQYLRQQLSKDDHTVVLSALQQDPLIWQSLEDSIFQARAKEVIGKEASQWSPAQLGMIALRSPVRIETLLTLPIQPVEESLRSRAAEVLESLFADPAVFQFDLENVTLIALYLREAYIEHEHWTALIELAPVLQQQVYFTVVAILFGLLPEPDQMLDAVLNAGSNDRLGLSALHSILSNPLSPEKQCTLLFNLLGALNTNQQVSILRSLSGQRKTLAKRLARQLLGQPHPQMRKPSALRHQAEMHRVSEQFDEALKNLQDAWKESRSMQLDAAFALASDAAIHKSRDVAAAALEFVEEVSEGEAGNDERLLLVKLDLGEHDVKSPLLIEDISHVSAVESPEALILAAHLASKKGLTANAKTFAVSALNLLDKKSIASNNLQRLAELLLELELPHELIKAAEIGLKSLSNSTIFLYLLSRGQHMARQLEAAAQNAYAAATQDDDPAIRRHLVAVLMDIEFWEAAQGELQRLIEQQSKPETNDLCNLADCALHLDQPDQAAEAGQQAISISPDHGYAHALLGKAMMELGNPQTASEHLRKATQLNPEISEAWLALSQYYAANHENANVLNTLQAGVQALPQAVELHYALGQAQMSAGAEVKALEAFEEVSNLLEESEHSHALSKSMSLDLGNTFHSLGETERAKQAIHKGFEKYPNDAEIAAALADLLMQEFDYRAALEALAVILEDNSQDLHANLNVARAHIALEEQPQLAIAALEIVRAQDPNHDEAALLLADAYRLDGATQQAYKAYSTALETDLAQEPQWRVRVQLGLADVALEIGKPDVAIATLQDAQTADPSNTTVLRSLAHAYQAADLPHEAYQIALEAYTISAEDLDVILWFAGQASIHEAHAAASEALQRAVELQPDDTETLLTLGQTQVQLGADSQAKITFHKLLESGTVSSKSLLAAAQCIQLIDSPQAGLAYLERGQEIDETPDPELLEVLVNTYHLTGANEKALTTVGRLLEIEPDNVDWLSIKANLLIEMERNSAALACLEHALQLAPGHAKLHSQTALLFHSMDDLLKALDHAEQALSLAPEDAEIRYNAAEIALACLRSNRAQRILEIVISKQDAFNHNRKLTDLAAEVSIDNGNYPQAEKLLAYEAEEPPDEWNHALGAYLAYAQGDVLLGDQFFTQAQQSYSASPSYPTGRVLAKAAIAGHAWEIALELLESPVLLNTGEPRPHLLLARTLVERSEYAQRCRLAGSQRGVHQDAWSQSSVWARFESAINQAKATAPFEDSFHGIAHLYARGVDIFSPEKHDPKIASYPNDAQEVATALNHHKGDLSGDAAKKLAQKHPTDSLVLMALACVLESSNPSKALEAGKRAIESAPSDPLAHALTARLAHAVNEDVTACHHIEGALSLWENEAEWHSLAGHIHAALGDEEPALQHFARAHELLPDHAQILFDLGKGNFRAGKLDAAIQAFEKSLELDMHQTEVLIALGQAQREANKLMLAGKNIDKAIKLQPNSWEVLFLRAQIALQSGDSKQAIKFADAALKVDNSQSEIYLLKTEALQSLNKTPEAISELEKAVTSVAISLPVQLARAHLLEQTGDIQASLTLLKDMALEAPNEPEILLALSKVLEKAGRPQDAVQAAQQANRHCGHLPQNMQALYRHHLGRLLEDAGQLDQAIEHLSEAIRLDPQKAEPHLELAIAYRMRRQYPQALEHFQQAIALAPQDPRAYWESAQILKDSKDYEGAETMLRHAAGLAPDDVNIQRQLAAVVALTLVHPTREVMIQA